MARNKLLARILRSAATTADIEVGLLLGKNRRYTVTETLGTDGSISMCIELPDGSNDVLITRAIRTAEGLSGDISINVDNAEDGTALDAANLRVESPALGGGPEVVTEGGDYSGGESSLDLLLPSGSGLQTRGGTATANAMLTDGANIGYNLDSEGSDNECAIELIVTELPPTYRLRRRLADVF